MSTLIMDAPERPLEPWEKLQLSLFSSSARAAGFGEVADQAASGWHTARIWREMRSELRRLSQAAV